MATQPEVTVAARGTGRPVAADRVYLEGFVAGLIGAATVALWFLALDVARGRPLLTPTVLGAAIFRGGAGVGDAALGVAGNPVVSLELVALYTWVHALVFCVIGGIAAHLLAVAERKPDAGFGILLLFVVLEFGFVVVAMVFAEPVLHTLTWPAVLFGNLLAAAAMGAYFWRRHPDLRIQP